MLVALGPEKGFELGVHLDEASMKLLRSMASVAVFYGDRGDPVVALSRVEFGVAER
jgi:hypothetical protein